MDTRWVEQCNVLSAAALVGATDWNVTAFNRYDETSSVELAEPDRAVGGKYRISDESRGLTGNYRRQLAGQVVDPVAESSSAAVPG